MVEHLPARTGSEKADRWLQLLQEIGCLSEGDVVAPLGKRLEFSFEGDKIGPIHHDHGLTKARIEGIFLNREHLENVTYFRLDDIRSVTIGRER